MNEIRKRAWQLLLLAEINHRYFGYLKRDYYNFDLWTKAFLALTASSSVGGWIVWNDATEYPNGVLFWHVMSGVSAALSCLLPLVNFAKKLEVSSTLTVEWEKLAKNYDLLWLRIESGSIAADQSGSKHSPSRVQPTARSRASALPHGRAASGDSKPSVARIDEGVA